MKKIHQIFISDGDHQLEGQAKDNVDFIKLSYPNHKHTLYNDKEIIKILEENFDPSVLSAYKDVKAYTFKADIAKMCILYLYGGYYFDLGITLHNPIIFDDDIMFVKGIKHPVHTLDMPVVEMNFLFVKNTHNNLIKKIIDKIVENVNNLNYGIHPLDITSPIAAGRVINLDTLNHHVCEVKMDAEGNKSVYYKNQLFYDFKLHKNSADISFMGVKGTNRYDTLWFNNDCFNIRLSYIMLTNNPTDPQKKKIEEICIKSVVKNLSENDELIIIGKTSHLKHLTKHQNVSLFDYTDLAESGQVAKMRNVGVDLSKGNIVINLDNDVLIPIEFRENLLRYIKNNKNFDTLNVKLFLPNGGRCWDRAVCNTNLPVEKDVELDLYMVDYNYTGNNLWYNGPLIIRKKYIAKLIPFPENIKYRGGEEIYLSQNLIKSNFNINIDTNNFAFHWDETLFHVKLNNVRERVVKTVSENEVVISNKEERSKFKNLVKFFY
jgi:hypothetical protein